MPDQKLHFVIKGFREIEGSRVFEFESIAADWTRTGFTVSTDLALSRRYGIRLQELPLLCRALLEDLREGEQSRAFTYTEADMCRHASDTAARQAAAQKRKSPRRPVKDEAGAEPGTVSGSGNFGSAFKPYPFERKVFSHD